MEELGIICIREQDNIEIDSSEIWYNVQQKFFAVMLNKIYACYDTIAVKLNKLYQGVKNLKNKIFLSLLNIKFGTWVQ